MPDRVKGITIEIGGDITGLSNALKGINGEIKNTKTQLADVNKLLKMDPTNTDLLRQRQRLLADAIGETKTKLDALYKAEQQARQQLDTGKLSQGQYDALIREIAATEQELQKLEKQAGGVSAAMESITAGANQFADWAEKVSDGIGKVAKQTEKMSQIAAAAIGAAGYMAIGFEDAMAKVSTIADTSAVSMEDMSDAIVDLSNKTGIASKDIAEAVYNAISAGQDTADAVGFVERATMLARAGFTDTASSLDVLTTIMNAYGLEAEKVADVSDILIGVQNYGKTTVGELASVLGRVIPTANAYGVELDQVGTAYAIMTANGVNAQNSTTQINALLTELGKSGTTVSDTLKEKTGQSFDELMRSGKSLGEVLEIINAAAEDQGLAFGDLFGSSEAARAGMTLLGKSSQNFNDMLKKLRNTTGATETAFGKLDTTSYKAQKTLNEAKNTLTELGQTVLKMIQPWLGKASDMVGKLTDAVDKMNDKQKETIVNIGLAVAAFSPVMSVLSQVTGAISGVSRAIAMVLSNPVTATIAGVVAAVGAFELAMRGLEAATAPARLEIAGLTEEEYKLIEAANETADKLAEQREATDEQAGAYTAQMKYAQELATELRDLAGASGEVDERNRDRAEFILGQLNEALGTEYTMVGNQIQGYRDLKASIDEVIESKTANMLLDMHQADYENAIQARMELYDALTLAEQDLETASAARSAAEQELYGRRMEMFAESGETWESWINNEMQQQAVLLDEEYRVLWQNTQDAIETYNERRDAYAELAQAYYENGQEIQEYENATIAIQQGNYNDAIAMLRGKTEAYNRYEADVGAASARVLDTLRQEALDAGIEADNARRNFDEGVAGWGEEQVRAAEENYQRALDAYVDAYVDAYGIAEDFGVGMETGLETVGGGVQLQAYDLGVDMGQGVINGLESKRQEIENTITSEVNGAIAAARSRRGVDAHSPARKLIPVGVDMGRGIEVGVDRMTVPLENAVIDQMSGMINAYDEAAQIAAQSASLVFPAMPGISGGATNNTTNSYGGVSIIVNGAPGQDVHDLANIIMEEMQHAVSRREAVYS